MTESGRSIGYLDVCGPHELVCAHCGAAAGEQCRTAGGREAPYHHPRLVEYNRIVDERIRLAHYSKRGA